MLCPSSFAVNGSDSDLNNSLHDPQASTCAAVVPNAQTLFADLPTAGYVAFAMLVVFTVITLALYAEEIVYIVRNFENEYRKRTTLWILAIYPVYSCCAILGAAVPRSGPLVDMIASVYFGTCLYNFSGLMMNYLGGRARVINVLADGRPVKLNTPPLCCCCVCLPLIKFRPAVMSRITFLVMQIVVVRPVMMFSGAVLFVNGNFDYGTLTPYPMYAVISVVNFISVLCAIYGLMLFQRVFRSELEKRYLIVGKILSIQLTLVGSSVPNLIMTLLVAMRVIKCNSLLPAPTTGDEITQCIVVLIMMPLSIVGRVFFRRAADAKFTEKDARPTCSEVDWQQVQQPQQQMTHGLGAGDESQSLVTKKPSDLSQENDPTNERATDNDNADGGPVDEEAAASTAQHRSSTCDPNGDGLNCSWWHQTPV